MKEMVGGCCVCSDERGWPDNPLVYCDGNGCTVAVHQACYGIVTVPTGPWYCRKCESPETKGKVKCELCPSKSGALKRSDTGGWAHVVCALYIPEVRFGNVTSMEPIVLKLIPPERYNKQCYICQDSHKSHRASAGACMQCNKSGCKQQFHVTCAQSLGLLCEEAGNYLDNVKYCGYCQHHYSKLKKGGNVKTIPPYKPVMHDGQSSDSSGEKEGDTSPLAGGGGGGTPTHQASKPKGLGRKSSHGGSVAGKNTSNASKTPTNSNPPSDVLAEPIEPPSTAGGRKHKSSDKNKKKSPARRGSSASEAGGSGSKNSTPAPSPQHAADTAAVATHLATSKGTGAGGSTPGGSAKAASPGAGASRPTPEPVGVISSVASSGPSPTTAPSSTVVTSPSVVQGPSKPAYQESVITNAESMETKQTKKRKAVSQANAQAAAAGPANPPSGATGTGSGWEASHAHDVQMDDKAVKKAKTESEAGHPAPFSSVSPAPPPPPPPPAQPVVSQPSPRHLQSPMPGSSGMNQAPNIRSPSQPAGAKGEREWPASLLVSVPLPSTSHGLNLTAHAQVSTASDTSGNSSHIYHQHQKQASTDPGVAGHPQHAARSWGGLNVSYEMQQDPTKPGVSGVAGPSKEVGTGMNATPPPTIRNKKRAALAASVVSMANSALATSQAQAQAATQSLASVRRQPVATPSPVYQETIKDSPPGSPNSDRPLKPKMETSAWVSRMGPAPHMLGNELNPESGAAARLQEQLTAELAAHAAGTPLGDHLVPPPLINKAQGSGGCARSGSSAQSLDQLLERQWEQGSQFLMEQAQHFDIASLLSCLHQLRTENVRLEEHVGGLLQRRDHLLAVNARLAIPLTTVSQSGPEPSRCARDNVPQPRAQPPPPMRAAETVTSDRPHQLMMREVQQKPS